MKWQTSLIVVVPIIIAVAIFIIFRPDPVAPIDSCGVVSSGSQIRNPVFLAIPSDNELQTGRGFVPVLAEYSTSFDALNVEVHEKNGVKCYSVSPLRQPIPKEGFIPRIRFTGGGNKIDKSIEIVNLESKKIPLGKLGHASFEFGGKSQVMLSNARQAQLELGDFDYISELANIYKDKINRVYFSDRIWIADITEEDQKGISIKINNSASVGIKSSDKFSGSGVVLGADFNVLRSSLLYDHKSDSGTVHEKLARDLQNVLGISKDDAIRIADKPIQYQASNDTVQVEFASPIHGSNEKIKLLTGAINGKSTSNGRSIELPLKPRLYTLSYVTYGGNRAYQLEMRIKIGNDNKISVEQGLWSAIRWERLNIAKEYHYRNNATTEEILKHINILWKELFSDAVRLSTSYTSSTDDKRTLSGLLKTAPARELIKELKRLPPEINLTADQITQRDIAKSILNYLEHDEFPSDAMIQQLESSLANVKQQVALLEWMKAQKAFREGKLLEAADGFRLSGKLYGIGVIQLQLYDRAIATYIELLTREAEKVAKAPSLLEKAMPYINSENARRRAIELIRDGTRESRFSLDWRGKKNAEGIPYPWFKTVYIEGKKVAFRVNDKGYSQLEADQGSLQISSLVNVDVAQYPFLNWVWRVDKLPKEGNAKYEKTDDQAIQIVATFELPPETTDITALPKNRSVSALNFVWDSNASKGTIVRNRKVGYLQFQHPINYLVLRTGSEDVGTWQRETINLLDAFAQAFPNKPAPERVIGITVQTNSQNTKTVSGGSVGQIRFTKEPLSTDIPLL